MPREDRPPCPPLARLRMEEYTNAEIAARLGCTGRTVERKLVLIRGSWESAGPA